MPGHWQNSTRRTRLPKNWPTIRTTILTRDHHQCQWVRADTGQPCHHPARDVDHITPGDNHHPNNLQALCPWHHNRKSSREGHQAKRRPKPPPPHPGLLP
ncbi:MAG: hypothetical protein LBK42_10285 [Propionibacteriaceae bacterium]|jgi:5-methylcytosine-specific restriction endonuclease McrA|nr:hypothetical protein [Propionibacteriaceae bacterium]